MLPILMRKVGVLYLNVKSPDLQKCLKALEDNFFLERAVKALPLFIYLTIKKKTSVGSVLSKNSI